ncbi:MAG: caspase family protein [Pseudomonadota bacterium]
MQKKKSQNLRTFLAVTATATAALFASEAVAAESHALVIGVSQYQNLPKQDWLKGPANDVVLVRDFLQTNPSRVFEPENITVLADGVENAEEPTLQAIRTAFADLAAAVDAQDFVYLHFSGHGSQVPAINAATEIDGLDEILMPADFVPKREEGGSVENALIDDEIGEMIDAIRAKGAHVWAVFDSCHSGTVTRATSASDPLDAEVSRRISPASLGLSEEELEAARITTRGTATVDQQPFVEALANEADVETGSLVAFFAAQTTQETVELRQPAGEVPRQTHGLFTFSLFEALAQNPSLTYRQLGQEILRQYSVDARVNPIPLFEGDLENGVFATEPADAVTQWQIQQKKGALEIAAGQLHGLNVGDRLGLVRTATQNETDENVSLVVSEVEQLSATLTVESDAFTPIETGFFARKIDRSVDYTFTIGLPEVDERTHEIDAMLIALQDDGKSNLRIEFAEPGTDADIQLVVRDDVLWFVGADGVIREDGAGKTHSLNLVDKSVQEATALLADTLRKMARVRNVVELAGIYRPSQLGLAVGFEAHSTERSEPMRISSSSVTQLVPGDVVFIKAENINRDPVDVNILYVGSDYSIGHLYKARMNPTDKLDLDLFDVTTESFGRERILTIVTPAQTPTEDMSWLEQDKIERTRAAPKGAFGKLLQEAAFDDMTTRGASRRAGAGGGIAQFLVDVVPTLN